MEHFHFISDLGKISLPTKEQIATRKKETGEEIIFVLDSSVCIDIRNLIKWKSDAKSDKNKIFNLIEYVQKNNLEWFPLFALIESCYDRKTLEIKADELTDFNNKIDFAFYYPLKELKKFKFFIERDFIAYRGKLKKTDTSKIIIQDMVNIYYAALLKIALISKNGLSAKMAERNINEFIDWMINDLDVILGFEYTLALQIFGGNSRFQSMIKVGGTKEKIMKATWSTAWDMLHARMSCNIDQMSLLVSRKVYPIFVTKDATLYDLLSPEIKYYIREGKSKFSILEQKNYPPHYSDEIMENINNKIFQLISKRKGIEPKVDANRIKILISLLEDSL